MTTQIRNVLIFGAGLVLVVIVAIIFLQSNPNSNNEPGEITQPEEMSLVLFLQDKEAARTTDCSVTYPVTLQVPKNAGVADVSLQLLFAEELSQYGTYESVRIVDGVAEVTLQGERLVLGSLASCEAAHLMSVLSDTLTQYESISDVELYTIEGKVEF